ncbi:MAG: OmpA family protein [Clostridia bacterium]|nr:OmpA family protein [Clostridia bacterium]
MARQRIHNSRTGTGAGNAGASWISYSDMMAALLLVFVLILSVSLYQYFTMLETTQKELEAQQAQLEQQQIILLDQQSQLDTQTLQLAAQQVTMDNQNALIVIMQGEIAGKQEKLDEQEKELFAAQNELKLSQQELVNAIVLMQQQQAELNSNKIALSAAQKELENQKNAFRLQTSQLGNMVGVKAEIIAEVSSSLNARHVSAKVDPSSGDIAIDSRMLTFETNKATLSAESKRFLDSFVPVYLEVLMRPEYKEYLGSIIIEGHTDKSGSYERNMELSQERALEVLLYIRSMYQHDSLTLARLDQILVATGKSYSDPVYNSYGYPDPDASRRVEFKFSLRDAEMIEEINRLLNGQ